MKGRKILNVRYVADTIIIGSVLGLTITFFPIAKLYLLPPPSIASIEKKGTYISIPKINAHAPIIENVDPFNKTAYNKALEKGIAHAKGTTRTGEKGMTFLFAHSSGTPWEQNQYNTVFFRLGELTNGDTITTYRDGKETNYTVVDKKEVWPNEVNYLLESSKNQLILQTCTPIGTSLKRLLVFAAL